MRRNVHLSNLLVHVRPEALASLKEDIGRWDGVDIQTAAADKVVVILETDSEAQILEQMDRINALPGVISAVLVYHHFSGQSSDVSPDPVDRPA